MVFIQYYSDVDHNDDPQAGFAYVSAKTSEGSGSVTEIELSTIDANTHMLECLHFWYAIKVNYIYNLK